MTWTEEDSHIVLSPGRAGRKSQASIMVLDYSKWDALELSDDSDIEVHPNVDKRSFIRAKQNQIHQERQSRKHQIETLKYERIINDGLLKRIDDLVNALNGHLQSAANENTDEIVFRSLLESAGDPADDQPPDPPAGVHENTQKQPAYSKMMAELVDQVKKQVEATKPSNKLDGYIKEVGQHKAKVLDLQQQLLAKLAELEKLEKSKITSESIHTGFDSSHVSKAATEFMTSGPPSSSKSGYKTELLNAPNNGAEQQGDPSDSGVEADTEDASGESVHRATHLGKAFAKISPNDPRACLEYISQNPAVLAERETDGLLLMAFDAQSDGRAEEARNCVHQALLLQYCRSLGRDGVSLFFKRITTPNHEARKLFLDDVNSTYARLRDRAAAIAKEEADAGDDGPGVEQIQLHAVNPGQEIHISVPSKENPEEAQAREVFESFPPNLQRALEGGSLDEVNVVLGKMSVDEAEEIVGKLGEGGMLSLEEGIVDTTTEEGKEALKRIEEEGRQGEEDRVGEVVDEGEPGPAAVDLVD